MVGSDGVHSGRPIRVLIVADVRLYREGLAASLASRERAWVIATSASRSDAGARVRDAGADVVVIDMATRESLDLIHDIRREAVPARILAFAVEEVTSDILDCAEAGAAGYVTADASIDDLVAAIDRIAREELVCSPRIAATLFRHISERADGSLPDLSHPRMLTIRERQVLDFISQGHSNKEIAQKLNIAEPTVKNHVHHLLEKMDVTTRAQAAARASRPTSRRRPFDPARLPSREAG
jgi:two-component system, NarL family, nitrate/nitrite response regulator NarL